MQTISYIMTALSIVGTVANAFQKRWCFIIWLFTNLFWVIYDLWIGAYGQALLYVVNCVTCVIGLWRWKKIKTPDVEQIRAEVKKEMAEKHIQRIKDVRAKIEEDFV